MYYFDCICLLVCTSPDAHFPGKLVNAPLSNLSTLLHSLGVVIFVPKSQTCTTGAPHLLPVYSSSANQFIYQFFKGVWKASTQSLALIFMVLPPVHGEHLPWLNLYGISTIICSGQILAKNKKLVFLCVYDQNTIKTLNHLFSCSWHPCKDYAQNCITFQGIVKKMFFETLVLRFVLIFLVELSRTNAHS